MKHELFTIKMSFIVGEGMTPQVLDEIKQLKLLFEGNPMSDPPVLPMINHASNHRWEIDKREYIKDNA